LKKAKKLQYFLIPRHCGSPSIRFSSSHGQVLQRLTLLLRLIPHSHRASTTTWSASRHAAHSGLTTLIVCCDWLSKEPITRLFSALRDEVNVKMRWDENWRPSDPHH